MGRPGRPSPVSVWAAGLGIVLGLVAHPFAARAHDVWLEPTSFRPEPGASVAIEVMVGEDFEGEAVPRRPTRIRDFRHGDGATWETVRGVDGVAPAGVVRIPREAEGWHVVRYLSRPAHVSLSPERFALHLEQEGIAHLLAGRPLPAEAQPVRERYTRCVGALLEVRSAAALASGRNAGSLPPPPNDCELVLWPESIAPADPAVAAGSAERRWRVDFRLTRDGSALAGAVVRALLQGSPDVRLEARSGVDGGVELMLPRAGVWLIKAIHMEPAAEEDVDWRSWWSTLTFEVGDG